jgi:Insect cuticle protein
LSVGLQVPQYELLQRKLQLRAQHLVTLSSIKAFRSLQVFLGFALIAAAAAHAVPSHGYKVEVKHEHYPVQHHQGYHHSAPVAVEAAGHYYGGDSYAHGGGHDDSHDYYHHPSYKFEYGVKDDKTGDHKSQWEHRDGDVVHGEYTLDEADGTKRVVKYHADDKHGFTAVVEKIGHAHHDQGHHGHHY